MVTHLMNLADASSSGFLQLYSLDASWFLKWLSQPMRYTQYLQLPEAKQKKPNDRKKYIKK